MVGWFEIVRSYCCLYKNFNITYLSQGDFWWTIGLIFEQNSIISFWPWLTIITDKNRVCVNWITQSVCEQAFSLLETGLLSRLTGCESHARGKQLFFSRNHSPVCASVQSKSTRRETVVPCAMCESEVWTITHNLGLGHETMVCAVCLFVFLSWKFHENPFVGVLLMLLTGKNFPHPHKRKIEQNSLYPRG